MRILEPVEASDFVGTVICTVTRSHTAIVNLFVESFTAMDSRQHRTDGFAGGIVTVLSHHRLVVDVHLRAFAGIVTIDAYPVHFALATNLVVPNNWHVVR